MPITLSLAQNQPRVHSQTLFQHKINEKWGGVREEEMSWSVEEEQKSDKEIEVKLFLKLNTCFTTEPYPLPKTFLSD